MDLDKIETLIDRAIEDEDFERLVELLDERERIFQKIALSPEKAEEILKKDEERLKKIESMKNKLLDSAYKSREYVKHLEAFRRTQKGKSWGKG